MRSSFARRLAMLALIPAALFGSVAVASPAVAAPSVATLQNDILRHTNYQRAKHGCKALRSDSKIGYAARGHAGYMARNKRFSHTGSGGSTFAVRLKRAGYTAPLSENIAYGYRTGAQVVSAWMKSKGHRANILNCRAKAVGIGAFYASNGTPYYAQDFGTR